MGSPQGHGPSRPRQPAARSPAWSSSGWRILRSTALLLLSILACSGTLILEAPDERGAATPLAQAPHPRSGSLTYRLGQIERTEKGVRIDLTLQNGSSRDIEQGLLRILLMGPEGELVSARLPFGALSRRGSRPMSARFPPVGFRIQDLTVELIFVTP